MTRVVGRVDMRPSGGDALRNRVGEPCTVCGGGLVGRYVGDYNTVSFEPVSPDTRCSVVCFDCGCLWFGSGANE